MTAYDKAVADALDTLPLTRLAHFTPARNLPHILRDRELRSVEQLDEAVRAAYTPTDRDRLDGHRDKICCSLQYPNSFYFAKARDDRDAVNFPDWACLLLDRTAAAIAGTVFCQRNAGAGGAEPGAEALLRCYAPTVMGHRGRTYTRSALHDPASPTDVQAELLIPGPVPLSLVRVIVFPSDAAAREEHGRLDRYGLLSEAPPFAVAPGLFQKWTVSDAVTRGAAIDIEPWAP